jgi:predicted dehydrogenase
MPDGGIENMPLRIAVIGAGVIGRTHVKLVQQSPSCALAAIVDPVAGAGELARELGVPHYRDIAALLADQRPDGAIVASPNHLHVEQGLALIAVGIPCLIEKPVAHDVAEGERLCAAAEQARVAVLIGHHRLHSPIIAEARTAIADGALGRIVAIMGSALFYKPTAYFAAGPWRSQPGGGPILINMIHEIASMRALAGEIAAVQAFTSSKIRAHAVEDTASISLQFASGALGNFVLSDTAAASLSWEQTSGEDPAFAHDPTSDNCVVVGTRGSLFIPSLRIRSFAAEAEPSWHTALEQRVIARERKDPMELQLAHFCKVIGGTAPPLVSARDGLANLRVVEAIVEAARSGRTVRLT